MNVYRPSEDVSAEDPATLPLVVVDEMEDEYEGAEPSIVALNAIEREEFDALVAVENSPSGMLSKLVMFAQQLLRRFRLEKFEANDPELGEWAAISRTIAGRHMQYLSEFEASQYRDTVAAIGTQILLTLLAEKVDVVLERVKAGEAISSKDADFAVCNNLLHEIGGHYLGAFDAAQCHHFNTVMGNLVHAMSGPVRLLPDTVRDEEDALDL